MFLSIAHLCGTLPLLSVLMQPPAGRAVFSLLVSDIRQVLHPFDIVCLSCMCCSVLRRAGSHMFCKFLALVQYPLGALVRCASDCSPAVLCRFPWGCRWGAPSLFVWMSLRCVCALVLGRCSHEGGNRVTTELFLPESTQARWTNPVLSSIRVMSSLRLASLPSRALAKLQRHMSVRGFVHMPNVAACTN